MSDTRARASRFALAFGSFARNGLIGGRAGVGVAEDVASVGGAATGGVGAGGPGIAGDA